MSNISNLPLTMGGFTFNGYHSSVYGVRKTPESQVLMPQKRRTLLDIPGRSSAIIQEDGGYNTKTITVTCSYVKQEGVTLERGVRLIAGWLSVVGELVFDNEPEMRYTAFLNSAPPTTMMLEYATFDLEFTINHPFAYELMQDEVFTVANGGKFTIKAGGTIKTPPVITLKNLGTQPITNILIAVTHIKQ